MRAEMHCTRARFFLFVINWLDFRWSVATVPPAQLALGSVVVEALNPPSFIVLLLLPSFPLTFPSFANNAK